MVRFFERLPDLPKENPEIDDAVFLITDTILIFDNIRHTVKVVACAFTEGARDLKEVYAEAVQKIEKMCKALERGRTGRTKPQTRSEKSLLAKNGFSANMTPEAFKEMVKKAKEYIYAGDIIQVVLSERLEGEMSLAPVDLYRALRYVNPSPYLFYLHLGDLILIGSSPEVMVRLEEGVAELRPIAGTRPRGKTEQEDRRLADDLLEDPKEKAEHVMLVDLGRNDLGRIARIGSVQVTQLMTVERYSHVMHLVSHVKAQLAPGKDCFDVLKGDLSGRDPLRSAEDPGHGNHRRTRAFPARPLWRGRGILQLHRKHGFLYHHSNAHDSKRENICPGGGGHRGGFGPRSGIPGEHEQSQSPAAGVPIGRIGFRDFIEAINLDNTLVL